MRTFQYSPDGRWWWDGQQWQPVEALAAAQQAAYSEAELANPPGTIKTAMTIGIAGALLVSALGLLVALVGGILASNPDFQTGFQEGFSRSAGSSIDSSMITAVVVGLGAGLVVYGLIFAAVNWGLMRFMQKRQLWAWIVALILIGLGTLIDLFQSIHSPVALVHVVVIELPMATFLLLSPTRRWFGVG